jgi:hypothetical protein
MTKQCIRNSTICNQRKMKKVRSTITHFDNTFNFTEDFYFNQVDSGLSWPRSVVQGQNLNWSGFVSSSIIYCLACTLEMSILPLVALNLLVQTKVPSDYFFHLSHLFHTQVARKLTIWSLHKKTITIANTHSQTQCIITNQLLPPHCHNHFVKLHVHQGCKVCVQVCVKTLQKMISNPLHQIPN